MLNENGFEVPDNTPVETPTRLRMPVSQVQRMRDIIRNELSMAARAEGFETQEEADDFSIDDEGLISPYEINFEPPAYDDAPDASGSLSPSPPVSSAAEGGKSEAQPPSSPSSGSSHEQNPQP